LAQCVCTTSKSRRRSSAVSRASARRSLPGAMGARSDGSTMTSRPAASASGTSSPRPVMIVMA
jgi:hypothetical protein